MSTDPRMLPPDLIRAVDQFVDGEIGDFAKYDNRQPFDESGCWALHKLAAAVYAAGWHDGERAEAARNDGDRRRARRSTEPRT